MDLNRQLSRPITTVDPVWSDWLKIGFSYSLAIATLAAVNIAWNSANQKATRIALPIIGIVSTAYGLTKTRQLQILEPMLGDRRHAQRDIGSMATAAQAMPYLEIEQPQYLLPQSNPIPAPFDVESFLGEVTGIAILGNSGAGKTQLAKFIAGHVEPSQILVLDPHADPESSDYPWENLTVISDKAQILEQLEILLGLLDTRDKTPLVIIADEYPAIRAYAKKQGSSVADDFILRYGSEARKFNKLPIFLSQSGNIKALGLEGMGDFLENFALIRLQKIARKYLKNSPDRHLLEIAKNTAYAMLIGEDKLVIHPTHGGYVEARKNLPPQNLKPLHSLPITIPLVGGDRQPINLQKQPPTLAPENNDLDYLTRCFDMEFNLGGSTNQPVSNNQPPNHLDPIQDKPQTPQPPPLVSHKLDPFKPLSGDSQQLVKRLLGEGWSQNKLVSEVFEVGSKGSKAYYQAVEIIKAIRDI
jgi:energy-coupling factor transporter ATP-binding protein EcfA2